MSLPFQNRNNASKDLLTPRWRSRDELHKQQLQEQVLSKGLRRAPPRRPTVGEFTGLCLLIAFPDVPAAVTRDEVDAFCNRPGYDGFGNNGSVFDYFHEVSGGRLSYRTVVAPLYTAAHPLGHYTDTTLPFAQRARELILEAIAFHRANGFDFSALTVDAQRGVYAMNVLYAGEVPNEWGFGLWPHASRLAAPVPLAARKSALDYQITAMGRELTLGVYCHENGHMLCDFPDLYDYADSAKGVGRYCLMCLGSYHPTTNPTRVSAYLRYRAGWGEAVPLTAGRFTAAAAQPDRFFIHRRDATEYFILENRHAAGRDAGLRSSGLAIWHIDELGSNAEPAKAPNGHRHFECVLLQADGLAELQQGLDAGDRNDLFGALRRPLFSDGTPVSSQWWDGTPSRLQIRSIEANGDDLSFTVELA